MSKPLLISDCDEVLLHMVVPFRDWVDEAHDIDFSLDSSDFSGALTHRQDGNVVEPTKIWELLGSFFDSEMQRQQPIEGAVEAMVALFRYCRHCHIDQSDGPPRPKPARNN